MDNMGRAAFTVIVTVRKEAHVVSHGQHLYLGSFPTHIDGSLHDLLVVSTI